MYFLTFFKHKLCCKFHPSCGVGFNTVILAVKPLHIIFTCFYDYSCLFAKNRREPIAKDHEVLYK